MSQIHKYVVTPICTVLGLALLIAGLSGTAFAVDPPTSAPEIDPGSIASALTLLSGGLLMLSARRKQA